MAKSKLTIVVKSAVIVPRSKPRKFSVEATDGTKIIAVQRKKPKPGDAYQVRASAQVIDEIKAGKEVEVELAGPLTLNSGSVPTTEG